MKVMQVLERGVKYERETFLSRFPVSCLWASLARRFGHPTIPIAYDSAILWTQTFLTFAPTLDIQHSRLVMMLDDFKTLP